VRVATIDLGTNAVRFDVHDLSSRGDVVRLHRERLPVRLGEGVFQTGRLSAKAMGRTLVAFRSFKHTCDTLGVEKVTAFGTSALRDSSNSDTFLRQVKRATGINLRIISGREEAQLIAQGILAHENKPTKTLTALVDIGGGSVEITLCRDRHVLYSASFKLGAARLQQVFLKTIPPSSAGGPNAPLAKLARHVKSLLLEGGPRGGWPRVSRVLGSAGTIRALARVEKEEGEETLTDRGVERLIERFRLLSLPKLLRVPGMDLKRAHTILAGACVLKEIVGLLDVSVIEPTDYSLRDGMLEEEVRAIQKGRSTALGFHLPDVFRLARRWGLEVRHLKHVEMFSRTLFSRLAPLHRLGRFWEDYLVAAGWFQDMGEKISPVHHERHSSYLVQNADVSGLEPWERDFIAQLVLWHKEGKITSKDIPFPIGDKKATFLKILALLRVVDALEKPQAHWVSLRRVERKRGAVRLLLSGQRSAVDLAILRVEQKKELFEKVFRVSLSAS